MKVERRVKSFFLNVQCKRVMQAVLKVVGSSNFFSEGLETIPIPFSTVKTALFTKNLHTFFLDSKISQSIPLPLLPTSSTVYRYYSFVCICHATVSNGVSMYLPFIKNNF